MNKHLDFKTNFFFPIPTRVLGYVMIIIGFIGVYSSGYETLLISLIGVGLSFTRMGVLFDLENKRIKNYTNIYGLKSGKWIPSKNYPYVTVLSITEKSSVYSQANVELSSKAMVYRVTLLNQNHYEKILLRQFKNKDLAHSEAEQIAAELMLEKVVYSPG